MQSICGGTRKLGIKCAVCASIGDQSGAYERDVAKMGEAFGLLRTTGVCSITVLTRFELLDSPEASGRQVGICLNILILIGGSADRCGEGLGVPLDRSRRRADVIRLEHTNACTPVCKHLPSCTGKLSCREGAELEATHVSLAGHNCSQSLYFRMLISLISR